MGDTSPGRDVTAAAMLKADVGSSLRLTEALQRESLSCEHPWGEH